MATVAYPDQADRPVVDQADDGLWDVLSVRDPQTGEPRLGNCQLLVGDHVLEFSNGLAKAPEGLLPTLLLDKRVRVPGYRGDAAFPPSAAVLVEDAGRMPDRPDQGRPSEEDLAAALAEDDAALGQNGATQPTAVAGREPTTKDGQPRCQAVKADGSQCENSAVEDGACGLSAHKSQLA